MSFQEKPLGIQDQAARQGLVSEPEGSGSQKGEGGKEPAGMLHWAGAEHCAFACSPPSLIHPHSAR